MSALVGKEWIFFCLPLLPPPRKTTPKTVIDPPGLSGAALFPNTSRPLSPLP